MVRSATYHLYLTTIIYAAILESLGSSLACAGSTPMIELLAILISLICICSKRSKLTPPGHAWLHEQDSLDLIILVVHVQATTQLCMDGSLKPSSSNLMPLQSIPLRNPVPR